MSYSIKISKRVLKHLGIQLYDTIPAVLAEFISNSYDADATRIDINVYNNQGQIDDAIFGKYLASRDGQDKGYIIEIKDNGHGMTPQEIDSDFLLLGRDRRRNTKKSRNENRLVTGNKGIGKLAPFGICSIMEIVSSGGEKINDTYLTGHIILKKDDMLSYEDEGDYEPEVGRKNGSYENNHGTSILLKDFDFKKIPDKDTIIKNIVSRFNDDVFKQCRIFLNHEAIAEHNLTILPETKISFKAPKDSCSINRVQHSHYAVINSENEKIDSLNAYFEFNDTLYPVNGWVAYTRDPIKEDFLLGIRIFCRGKIATKTVSFDLPSGYMGEFVHKSYITGQLIIDWLDDNNDDKDLISTDRNSIIWSHPICAEFQNWGQELVKYICKKGRPAREKRNTEKFFEKSNFIERAEKRYPGEKQKGLREKAIQIAKLLSKNISQDKLEDHGILEKYIDLPLFFAPHMELDDTLAEISKTEDIDPEIINQLLFKSRIADLAAYGRIAEKHIDVINTLQKLSTKNTPEKDLQKLLEEAPWLISVHSTPISQNTQLKEFEEQLNNYFIKASGGNQETYSFPDELKGKRPDFVFLSQEDIVEIIEIKKALSTFKDDDFKRLHNYYEAFKTFFKNDYRKHAHFKKFKIYLICENVKFQNNINETAYNSLKNDGSLEQISWNDFLRTAKAIHSEYLEKYKEMNIDE